MQATEEQLKVRIHGDTSLPTFVSLEKRCPGFRAARTIWSADHNVLGTQPHKSAEIILRWVKDN